MNKIILSLILLITLISNSVRVEAAADDELLAELGLGTGDHEIYKFPEIKPSVKLYSGYYWAGTDGPERIFEYQYFNDSPVIGGELRVFRYPHRYYLELDRNNSKDFYADGRYAYGDRALFRWLNTTSFHNLDNIKLVDLDPSTSSPGIDIRDNNVKYGVETGMNRYYFRLKNPYHPFHVFFNVNSVERKGLEQQRSLLGAAYFTNAQRVTQSRDINWDTSTYTIGANSHLGPLEIEYFHTEKRFNAKGSDVMFDSYGSSSHRTAGVFPHNRISEFKGSSDVVKIHTSYTGKLVASTTFSLKERENTSSSANEDVFVGEGSIRWMPLTNLFFSLKYSHREIDRENPATVSITDNSDLTNSFTYTVKPSLSSKTDRISMTGVYRLMTKTTLRSELSYKKIEREHAEPWNLQDLTIKKKASLSLDTRIIKNMQITAKYIYSAINSPSYNTEPDHSNKALASVSWMPAPRVSMLVSYNVSIDQRNDLHFTETEEAKKRDVKSDNVLGNVTFQLLDNLSLTSAYSYMRYKIEQDIVSETPAGVPFIDSSVPVKETAHVYSVSLFYLLKENMSLTTAISHSLISGGFIFDNPELVNPVSASSFSEHKVRETSYKVSGDYESGKGYSFGLDYMYKTIDDVLENIHDSVEDGDAHLLLLTILKKW